jgi:hypothetical protein
MQRRRLKTNAVSRTPLSTDDKLPSPDADTLQLLKGLGFEIRDTWLRDGGARGKGCAPWIT